MAQAAPCVLGECERASARARGRETETRSGSLLVSMLVSGMAVGLLAAGASHNYTRHPGVRPQAGAFRAEERVTLSHCFSQCDNLQTQCAGFVLDDAAGTLVCAYYGSTAGLHPGQADTVAFYEKGPLGPHPPPGPPLPPPPPPPPPPSPPPRAPDNFLCTFETDVGKGEPITINVTRSAAPNGVDHFHMLASAGFYNESAFIRYAPGFVVQWGVSGNRTLDEMYGHTG